MNNLVIIGAGGHGKVVADNALKNGYKNICFIDDNVTGEVMGFPIIGTSAQIEKFNDGKTDFIIGIGNNAGRKKISEEFDINWVTLIHPSAQIASGVSIGNGTVIMANAVVNAGTTIGEHCIINTSAVVEHDNVIGDYVHISPGVNLSGTVTVGKHTWIGTGSSVINNVEICEDVVIGAGSVVVRNVNTKGTYFGVVSKSAMKL
ncbi:MAG: acetyltransferase [Clostridia bacterium]|nr:acetyltransferase [Clostridia bacterium]